MRSTNANYKRNAEEERSGKRKSFILAARLLQANTDTETMKPNFAAIVAVMKSNQQLYLKT